jgi:hypothetical protein
MLITLQKKILMKKHILIFFILLSSHAFFLHATKKAKSYVTAGPVMQHSKQRVDDVQPFTFTPKLFSGDKKTSLLFGLLLLSAINQTAEAQIFSKENWDPRAGGHVGPASYTAQARGAAQQEHWPEFVVTAVNTIKISLAQVNTITPLDRRMLARFEQNLPTTHVAFVKEYQGILPVAQKDRWSLYTTSSRNFPRLSVYEEPLALGIYQMMNLDAVLNLEKHEREHVERLAQLHIIKDRVLHYPASNPHRISLLTELEKAKTVGYTSALLQKVETFDSFKQWEKEAKKRGLPGHFISSVSPDTLSEIYGPCLKTGNVRDCPGVPLQGTNIDYYGNIIEPHSHAHSHHIHPEKDEWEEWIHLARAGRLQRHRIHRVGK